MTGPKREAAASGGRSAGDAPLTIRLNGDSHPLEGEGTSLAELLASLGRDPRSVAVELNGEIVRRDRWGETRLTAGDRLEVVQFVQGGSGRGRG